MISSRNLMQEEDAFKVLPKEKRHKQSLGYLGQINAYYVYEHQNVGVLTDALNQETEEIYALAVVDSSMKIKGMIKTRDLFGLMGRQFGRALLSKKKACDIAGAFRSFDFRQNIFAVESFLSKDMQKQETEYYLLKDQENRFKGLFSSRDLLIYLSNITRKDIETARKLQQRISREESSVHEVQFDLLASSQAAKGVGGDYYALHKTRGQRWILSLCDVSGKGISASLLSSTLWGMMNIYDFDKGLLPFIKEVNKHIYHTFESEKFVTGVFMDFDAERGILDLCDMGHSYIFLHRDGRLRKLSVKGNMPIGVALCSKLEMSRIQLQKGDTLFIPTDGLLEQENGHGELYQSRNIGTIIQSCQDSSIEEIHKRIQNHFMDFKGEEHLHDDVSYLILKYLGENPEN